MNCIAAVDNNWAIGYKNDLLISIPADKRFFREITTGKVVIMGRNTLDSLPGGMPFKNRTNIVVTRQKSLKIPDAQVVYSIDEALALVKEQGYKDEDIFVVGGGSIYEQLLQYCDTAYITKINYSYQADTYFPNLDKDENWEMVEEGEENTYYDIEWKFCKYVKK